MTWLNSQRRTLLIWMRILSSGALTTQTFGKGGPAITIEVEKSTETLSVGDLQPRASTSTSLERIVPAKDITRSPFQRHRMWNKVLSVSDLVSPAWCVLHILSMEMILKPFMEGAKSSLIMAFAKCVSRNLINGLLRSLQVKGKRIWVEKKVGCQK